MKQCPYCKEEIQDDAAKCRFCGEYLSKDLKREKQNKGILKGCLVGCLVIIVLMFLVFCALIFFGVIAAKHISASIKMNFPNPTQYYPGGMEGLAKHLGDIFRQFFEQLRTIFGGGGAQTL
jgi:predicted nucleic acid-binding Zn ribbon protein